jgi:hypothetical protein
MKGAYRGNQIRTLPETLRVRPRPERQIGTVDDQTRIHRGVGRRRGQEKTEIHLSFEGTDKELVLNVTNFDAICDVTGKYDTEDWPGEKIELYPTKTRMGRDTVDCIRVRVPGQRTRAASPPTSEPTPEQKSEHTLRDDMDDAIPF